MDKKIPDPLVDLELPSNWQFIPEECNEYGLGYQYCVKNNKYKIQIDNNGAKHTISVHLLNSNKDNEVKIHSTHTDKKTALEEFVKSMKSYN